MGQCLHCSPGHHGLAPSTFLNLSSSGTSVEKGSWVLSGAEKQGELIAGMETLCVIAFKLGFTEGARWLLKLTPPLTQDTIMGTKTSQGELSRPDWICNLVGVSSQHC